MISYSPLAYHNQFQDQIQYLNQHNQISTTMQASMQMPVQMNGTPTSDGGANSGSSSNGYAANQNQANASVNGTNAVSGYNNASGTKGVTAASIVSSGFTQGQKSYASVNSSNNNNNIVTSDVGKQQQRGSGQQQQNRGSQQNYQQQQVQQQQHVQPAMQHQKQVQSNSVQQNVHSFAMPAQGQDRGQVRGRAQTQGQGQGHGQMPNPIISSDRCIRVHILAEERKTPNKFEHNQGRILQDIQDRTGTRIEWHNNSRDGSIDFIIFGKDNNVQQAKQLILKDFQAPITMSLLVPKAIHGKLAGHGRARFSEIQQETMTRITMPRPQEVSDLITIIGLKGNAERAAERLQQMAKEYLSKCRTDITVEGRYALFVTGPYNENIKLWEQQRNVKILRHFFIPPGENDKVNFDMNLISFDRDVTYLHFVHAIFTLIGEQQNINAVRDEIQAIFEEKKKKCTSVNIEVKKAQHRYITGVRGDKLRSFYAKTGVCVEMPMLGSDSDTITLRGEQSKLGPALSELYTQAHSETDVEFVCDDWLHKYLIGPSNANLGPPNPTFINTSGKSEPVKSSFVMPVLASSVLAVQSQCLTSMFDFKAHGVTVRSIDDRIKMHGAPREVDLALDWLEQQVVKLQQALVRKEIQIESRLRKFIIGKAGQTLRKIRDDSGVQITRVEFPEPAQEQPIKDDSKLSPQQDENNKTVSEEKLSSDEQKQTIEKNMENLSVTGKAAKSNNKAGNKKETSADQTKVDNAKSNKNKNKNNKKDEKLVENVQDTGTTEKLSKSEKKQAKSKQVEQVQQPEEMMSIVVDGLPEQVAQAEEKILEIAKKYETEMKLKVAQHLHGMIIGKKGERIKEIKDKFNQTVTIQFPDAGSTSDEIGLLGPRENVENCYKYLSDLANQFAQISEVQIVIPQQLLTPQYLGMRSLKISQFLEEFNNKIILSYPPRGFNKPVTVTMLNGQVVSSSIGENSASTDNKTSSAGNDQSVEQEKTVPPSSGKNKKQKKAKQQGGDQTQNSEQKQANQSDNKTNEEQQKPVQVVGEYIKIRGPESTVEKAVERLQQLIVEYQERAKRNFQMVVPIKPEIIDKLSWRSRQLQSSIRAEFDVIIKQQQINTSQSRNSNNSTVSSGTNKGFVITGYESKVKEAAEKLEKQLKQIEDHVELSFEIPSRFHPILIGTGGASIKRLMDQHHVEVRFAGQDDPMPDTVRIYGLAADAAKAKTHLLNMSAKYTRDPVQSGNAAPANPPAATGIYPTVGGPSDSDPVVGETE